MKAIKLATLSVIVFSLAFNTSFAQAKTKLIFSTIEGSLNAEVSSQVMTEAYKRIGVEIEILPFPAKRTLIVSNSGELDGELFRLGGITKKWPNLISVPVPINYMEGVVITKGKTFKVEGWKSLQPYRIGIRRGIRFTDNGTKGMDRQIVDSNNNLFRILEHDRVELIVVTRSNGLQVMKSPDFSSFKILEPAVEVYPLFHYLHIKNKELIPKVEAVLKSMQQEGRLNIIRNKVLSDFM